MNNRGHLWVISFFCVPFLGVSIAEAASIDSVSCGPIPNQALAQYDTNVTCAVTVKEEQQGVWENAYLKDCNTYCASLGRATIEQLQGLYASMRNHAQRVIARAYYRQTGSTNRKDALVKKAKDLERRGLKSLAKLPRTETVCK